MLVKTREPWQISVVHRLQTTGYNLTSYSDSPSPHRVPPPKESVPGQENRRLKRAYRFWRNLLWRLGTKQENCSCSRARAFAALTFTRLGQGSAIRLRMGQTAGIQHFSSESGGGPWSDGPFRTTRSSRNWARAGWAWFTKPTTHTSIALSPSKCCRRRNTLRPGTAIRETAPRAT